MKNSRKSIAMLVVFAGFIMCALPSCKKYPDGPLISLRSKIERVSNSWRVENYTKNGNDYTSLTSDYIETFSKGGDYSYIWSSLGGTGKWEFQNDNREIKLLGVSHQESHTLYILRLEEKSFWYFYMDGNDRKEFHLIPN